MIELLGFLLKKDHYTEYRQTIPKSEDKTLQTLLTKLDELHNSLSRDIGWDEYAVFVLSNWPNIRKQDKEEKQIAEAMLERAKSVTIEPDAADVLCRSLKDRQRATELGLKLLDFGENGKGTKEDLLQSIQQFGKLEDDLHDMPYVSDDLEELFTETYLTRGLRWRLNCLNQSLGSLRKGNFLFLFAYVETGKTTFLCSEGSHMLSQLPQDRPLLYVNNEEESKKVKMRFAQAHFGLTKQEINADLKGFKRRYQEEIADRLIIPDMSLKDIKTIEKLCVKHNPGLIIVDALSSLEGIKADREDLRVGAIFKWARELAKGYCPIIGTTWASDASVGKKWLNMNDVSNVKVEAQKHADAILGIGMQTDESMKYIRYLNIPKNKLDQDDDSNEAMRHGKFEVIIEPTIARYRDI